MRIKRIAVISMFLFLLSLPLTANSRGAITRERGWLGVSVKEVDPEILEAFGLADEGGVIVTYISKKSPAEKAGIKKGDVILAYNGEKIIEPEDLSYLVRRTKPDKEVNIVLIRKGKRITVKAKIESRKNYYQYYRIFEPPEPPEIPELAEIKEKLAFPFFIRPRLGLELNKLNPDLSSYFKTKTGVLVLDVVDDSPAKKAGFLPGDIIMEVGKKKVEDIDDITENIAHLEKGDTIDFTILRKEKKMVLKVKIEDGFRFRSHPSEQSFDIEVEELKKDMKKLDEELNERIVEELDESRQLELKKQLVREKLKLQEELKRVQEELKLKMEEKSLPIEIIVEAGGTII
jgi:predicted metalloprotease with PDZ domain